MNQNDTHRRLFARSPKDGKSAMNFGGTLSVPSTTFQYHFNILPPGNNCGCILEAFPTVRAAAIPTASALPR